MGEPRTYRSLARRKNLTAFRVVVEETDLYVHADRVLDGPTREAALRQREYIKNHVRRYPDFLTSLVPWKHEGPVPRIVRAMISAGCAAGVGPMAAVAGAIAEFVGKALLAHTGEVIVENGGDLFLKLNTPFTGAVFAGESPLSLRVGVRIDPGGSPVALCTSSGTVGHSLSLGRADAVCVVARSCPLADAAATAVGNRLQSASDIPEGVAFGKKIAGVLGILAIVGDRIGMWGDIEVVPLSEKRC